MSTVTSNDQQGDTAAGKRADIKARTLRTDRWWIQPAVIVGAEAPKLSIIGSTGPTGFTLSVILAVADPPGPSAVTV